VNAEEKRRLAAREKDLSRIRRRYKTNLRKSRPLLPGEVTYDEMAIILRIAGYSVTQICRTVGISVDQCKQMLEDPGVTDRLVAMRSALPQAALDLMQGYMVEAVQAIVDVMRKSDDDKLILSAAGEILDRSGLAKASRQERHQINESRTTITDDGLVDKLREASPEVRKRRPRLSSNWKACWAMGKVAEIWHSAVEQMSDVTRSILPFRWTTSAIRSWGRTFGIRFWPTTQPRCSTRRSITT
jgi:hypothetical protein